MSKNYSEEEFAARIESWYNRCFVCGEKLIEATTFLKISRCRAGKATRPMLPWEFYISETLISSNRVGVNGVQMMTYQCRDAINVHEECFFNASGDSWRF